MADDDIEDDSQKTEDPTPRRLEEAIKRGQAINSKEVSNFLMLLALVLILAFIIPTLFKKTALFLSHYIEQSHDIPVDKNSVGKTLVNSMFKILLILSAPLVISVIVALISPYLQNGRLTISAEPLIPKLEKISVFKGFKRIFSMQSVVEFVKGIFKLIIVSLVAYNSIKSELSQLKLSHDLSIAAVLSLTLKLSVKMMIGICIAMAIIAALDYLYQRHEFFKALRMSKHELKEEYRETEGSPEIKGKLKSMRMERAKQRMMAAVPKADVIITNPTHFSVALKYDMKKMRAPVVVAKGIDEVALRIREVAKKHDIPLYENAPLARTLYANVDLDKEIPVEHYKAVAEIISYVYKLKNKMPG